MRLVSSERREDHVLGIIEVKETRRCLIMT